MRRRNSTAYLVVHCSATRPDQDIGVREIRDYHVKKRYWADIGYHYLIRRNGLLELGRKEWVTGAHVRQYNNKSIGICLIGGIDVAGQPEDNFTSAQYAQLAALLEGLLERYPTAEVVGHRDLIKPGDPPKDCPCFDVRDWARENL